MSVNEQPAVPAIQSYTEGYTEHMAGGGHRGSSALRPENEEVMHKFRELTEQSRHYFSQLRDLPLYSNNNWAHYFHKSFLVYSNLWKFQQEHRAVLTQEGLQRWDIGEIASKIGQLYFNFYLRTSELRFLAESYTFYDAIRRRQYFLTLPPTAAHSLCHLRYYARFMVVCLLLNKLTEVWQFMNELQALIQTHALKFQEVEAAEWSVVITEIMSFLQAETLIRNVKPTAPPPYLVSKRLEREKLSVHKACVSDVVIISYYHRQLKIAELPVDAFRILQALEWEVPPPLARAGDDCGATQLANQLSQTTVQDSTPSTEVWHNPQKQLIYRSKVTRVLAQLAAAAEEVSVDKYLVVYLAANAPAAPIPPASDAKPLTRLEGRASKLRSRGVLLLPPPLAQRRKRSTREEAAPQQENVPQASQPSDATVAAPAAPRPESAVASAPPSATDPDQVLLAEDLIPLTRKRLVMIVDSDNATPFTQVYKGALSYPPLMLLSPTEVPDTMPSASQIGKLFTLFLSMPVHAIVVACKVRNLDEEALRAMQASVDAALQGLDGLLAQPTTGCPWTTVLQDAFMRRLILRFILCRAVLAQLDDFSGRDAFAPHAVPPLPAAVDAHSTVVKDLAAAVIRAAAQ